MASNPPRPRAPLSRQKLVTIGVLGILAIVIAVRLLMVLTSAPPAAPAPQAAVPAPAPKPAAPPPPPPAAAPGPKPPEFDVVRVDAEGNAVFAGRAQPGATLTIKDNGKTLGTVLADSAGAFVLVPASPLPPGAQEITLSETLPGGQIVASTGTADLNVPNGTGQALAVLSGPTGSAVLSGQGPQPGTLGLGTVDYDTKGHAIFSGTAPAGASVTLSLNGQALGTAIATAQGTWRFTAATPAKSGTLTLSGVTPEGKPLTVFTAPFALESLPYALAEGHVVIVPGDNLWMIARHVYGRGIMYTVIYNANEKQIRNPNLIYPGQNFALPKAETP